jgi:2-iminobutanoate/2-iminopropanoate deaminase
MRRGAGVRGAACGLVLAALLAAGCSFEAPPATDQTSDPTTAAGEPTLPPTSRSRIDTDRAPAAIGPYSQGVQVGNTLYLAGQIALDPASGEMVEGGIEAETRQVMENLGAVLEAAGFGFDQVVQSQVFLVDLADFAAMNEVYAGYFGDVPPARATVEVAGLPRGARVEILLTAAR